MVSRIIKTAASILLALLPYSTALSYFSPYGTAHSFQDYVVASIVFAWVSLLLVWIMGGKNFFKKDGFIFALLGMLVAPPLMLGIPEISPRLLERTTEEHFRYGLLIVATLAFAAGFILLIKKVWQNLSGFNKLIIVPFTLCVVLMLWDNFSSYQFSSELKSWIAAGNKAEAFFPQYTFHELYRTLGRSLLFILIPWLGYILLLKRQIKKWQWWWLSVFSLTGIVFFFLFNFVGFQFYFPFMIPAIALAPVYWLGLMLISGKIHQQTT